MTELRFDGQVAVITGGAGRGGSERNTHDCWPRGVLGWWSMISEDR